MTWGWIFGTDRGSVTSFGDGRGWSGGVKIGRTYYGSLAALFWGVWWHYKWRWHGLRVDINRAMGGCGNCGSFWQVHWHPSMTAYHWDGAGKDPNRPNWLCTPCGEIYDDHWQAMWDEYNHSRG